MYKILVVVMPFTPEEVGRGSHYSTICHTSTFHNFIYAISHKNVIGSELSNTLPDGVPTGDP